MSILLQKIYLSEDYLYLRCYIQENTDTDIEEKVFIIFIKDHSHIVIDFMPKDLQYMLDKNVIRIINLIELEKRLQATRLIC